MTDKMAQGWAASATAKRCPPTRGPPGPLRSQAVTRRGVPRDGWKVSFRFLLGTGGSISLEGIGESQPPQLQGPPAGPPGATARVWGLHGWRQLPRLASGSSCPSGRLWVYCGQEVNTASSRPLPGYNQIRMFFPLFPLLDEWKREDDVQGKAGRKEEGEGGLLWRPQEPRPSQCSKEGGASGPAAQNSGQELKEEGEATRRPSQFLPGLKSLPRKS